MADYNKLGIEMRYAAYPRSGVNTKSFYKAQAVWCSADRNKAMNFAKSGASLEQLKTLAKSSDSSCEKAISEHMKIAQQVGVSGTPTLVMENGQVLPGYVPPERIIKILQSVGKPNNK
jgi:thiol:disulfide interchange protein DsbC